MNNQQEIDELITEFYSIFDNRNNNVPDFTKLKNLFIDKAVIVKRNDSGFDEMTVQEFIEPRKKILANGSLINFHEWEVKAETYITAGLVTRISEYSKEGILESKPYSGEGIKHIQLISIENDWKIASIIWEDKSV